VHAAYLAVHWLASGLQVLVASTETTECVDAAKPKLQDAAALPANKTDWEAVLEPTKQTGRLFWSQQNRLGGCSGANKTDWEAVHQQRHADAHILGGACVTG
jgi:hypothetical protein